MVSQTSNIYDRLAEEFEERDILWKFETGYRVPNALEIRRVVDTAINGMYTNNMDWAETGGMLIRKSNKNFDIYLFIGATK